MCTLLFICSTSSYCIIPVIDEAAIGEHILVAANTLKSTYNEATQIKNQIDAYMQDAKHLVALPQSYLDQILGLYQEYNTLLNEGRGISYTMKNAAEQFEQLYAVATQGGLPIAQRLQAMANQVRTASQAATATTAIFDKLCADQTTVQNLIAVSQASPGSLAAQQAQAQLLGVLSSQQADLTRIQATIGRVQTGYIMRETIVEEHAQSEGQRYMADWPTEKMRAPMEGKGFALP
jgi:P-type conjugative transfer protein TrbJ